MPDASFTNGPSTACPFPTVTAAIHHNVCLYPEAVAGIDLSGSVPREITYADLERRALILARELRTQGTRPGDRVPLVAKRGIEMLVGIYAILLSGAQYVPMDGSVVAEKTLETVLEQSGKNLAVCIDSTRARFQCSESDILRRCTLVTVQNQEQQESGDEAPDEFADLATAEDGCYVIYTSGTTGAPKGVDVTHGNVTNLVCLAPGNLGIKPGTKVGSILSISFDMGAWEILGCLCNGGTLIMRGSNWTSALNQIDVMICTPSILSLKEPELFPNIKMVATAGERSWLALADKWASHGTYYNCCGPTETTIVNTMHKHIAGGVLTIGTPTPNNSVYILDDDLRPVPVGAVGTMWGGGRGISRGYVNLPEKTSERYLPDPFAADGSMMYNTGDLGRWLPCGRIEILGRNDDQVKVKGFRVELDGVANAMGTATSVQKSVALLIGGEIHGFLHPETCSMAQVRTALKSTLPYYAHPTHYHLLKAFPLTANGKVDKKALTSMAEREAAVSVVSALGTDSSSASLDLKAKESNMEFHLDDEPPSKRHSKYFRNLIKIIFIPYRALLSIVYLANIAVVLSMYLVGFERDWASYMVAINLNLAVLIRQDFVINALYTICCSLPKSWPLWIRASAAKIYHLGGIHSSAATWAGIWLLVGNINDAICLSTRGCGAYPHRSVAYQVLSWMISVFFATMIFFAMPKFRKTRHDFFERWHRFMGWTMLALFWAQNFVAIHDSATEKDISYGTALLHNPAFWLLVVATLSIASSWFWLRRVPVVSEVLSNHAIQLHFDYTVPVNGSFTRISFRPLFEWHSFATIPAPEAHGPGNMYPKGYSLVVSNAGDWTRFCIENPPTHLWVRSVPTCGVMRIATLFRRVVVIATGSGIGPCLGHIQIPSCPTAVLWSTKSPEKTFGPQLVESLKKQNPHAVIWDTTTQGRPDMVKLACNMVKDFKAEAAIIIANEKITKKVVYGLETRGVPCYGAIWDS
ncbi:AMP-binding enzyme [Thozetella sp. PMI_491]|nr:AMP-binding enzyme [Thozetella sp. PMI_491]